MRKLQGNRKLYRFSKRVAILSLPALLILGLVVHHAKLGPHVMAVASTALLVSNILCMLPFLIGLQGLSDYVSDLIQGSGSKSLKDSRSFTRSRSNERATIANAINALYGMLTKKDEDVRIAQHDFIANASHELKTPLSVLKGSLETLKAYPDAAGKFLPLMMAQVDRMENLIQNLLDLSLLESPDRPVELETFNLARVAIQAVRAMPCRIERLDRHLYVRGSPDEILRVLLNLLDNARKYGTPGTEPSISLYREPGRASAAVRNECVQPISPQVISRLTERFFRSDTSKNSVKGYGLGLPIVAAVLERHSGTFSVSSTLEEGTTFKVSIPIDAKAESAYNRKRRSNPAMTLNG